MMFMQRMVRAAQRIEPPWGEGDVERVWQGLQRKRRRRAIATGGATVALLAVAVSGLALLPWRGRNVNPSVAAQAAAGVNPPARPAVGAHAPEPLQLSDGSTAVARDGDAASLAVIEDSPQRVVLALAKGLARFEVVRRPERLFSVRAGEVTVSVLGTAFSVERIADRVGVAVTRGAVLVEWRTGVRRLAAGEDGWFPPLVVSTSTNGHAKSRPGDTTPTTTPAASAMVERTPIAAAPPPTDPRQPPPLRNRESAGAASLLADADRARLAGQVDEGAALLERLVREYPEDPRAPLAAFSLGRALLGELGRPADAARAFARARALAPSSPLAEDALAREVEAWGRAGDAEQARSRAAEYARVYPSGRRTEDVNEASRSNR